MDDISQTKFLKVVFEWKHLNFNQYSIEMLSLWFNWKYVAISSDNGMVPYRWQAII